MRSSHDEMRLAAKAVPECPFARMVIALLDEIEAGHCLGCGVPPNARHDGRCIHSANTSSRPRVYEDTWKAGPKDELKNLPSWAKGFTMGFDTDSVAL